MCAGKLIEPDPRNPAASVSIPEAEPVFEELLTRFDWAGERPGPRDLEIVKQAGAAAISQGMTSSDAIDRFLAVAAGWYAPLVGGDPATPLLALVQATLPVLMESYEQARQSFGPHEESERRQFIDDLLMGDADVAGLIQRAVPFGLDLARSHQIVMVNLRDGSALRAEDERTLARVVIDTYGDRDVLVTTKTGYLLALVPTAGLDHGPEPTLYAGLTRSRVKRPWRIVAGRPYPGVYGIARSYEEAREAMTMATRLQPDSPVIMSRDLLIFRVLGRDRVAMTDLVHGVLEPLTEARGGAAPLLETIRAYCDSGAVATVTAGRLHLSVRAVTYRLTKIANLTGYDPTDPAHRFVLQAAVLGARLLSWPEVSTGDASPAVDRTRAE